MKTQALEPEQRQKLWRRLWKMLRLPLPIALQN
jgi:hypothetical protein